MTIIGIDYGTKRVGVAISDTSETLAFPKEVIQNKSNANVAGTLRSIYEKEKARMIVLGHSKNSQGEDNAVMDVVRELKTLLEEFSIPVVFQEESWSSAEASRYQGHIADLDASAAAIILQRFLDTLRASENREQEA